MKDAKPKRVERINKSILRMLAIHARAFHLPHVRRYHAERKARQKSYDRKNPVFGKPSRSWTLPLHLVDIGMLDAAGDAGEHGIGWTQFIRWKYGMVAVADIRENLSVSRLATGKSARVQYDIAERILSSPAGCEDFRIIAVPVVHFRALIYIRRQKKNKQKIVVPILSSGVPLQVGRRYTAKTVCKRLDKALERRIQSAIEGSRRNGMRQSLLAIDTPNGRSI